MPVQSETKGFLCRTAVPHVVRATGYTVIATASGIIRAERAAADRNATISQVVATPAGRRAETSSQPETGLR